ncbi:MAG TPA: serine/threonine-protein kinase [Polyangiaceae bacterium]|nr:serine/threonine-protein kinase [Polyangiaceae bacterium]
MTRAVSPVQEGELVAGKYRVTRTIGAGGMGIVVAATQIELDRPVALKFLLPEALERPDIAARFAREARAAAKLEGEHITRVLDVGSLPTGEGFIVMEYLEGVDLARVLARDGALPHELAVKYVLEACEGVAEAHAHGIVHRDLKPGNLFLAKRINGASVIKVLDFGISKFTSAEGSDHVTSTSSLLGSPVYMSPEQLMAARTVDARSDIWALGVVLFELLCGVTPFQGERMPVLVAAILHRPALSMDTARPDLPPGLGAVVHRCLEKEPSKRFANVAEFATALAAFGPPASERSLERIVHTLGLQPLSPTVEEKAPPSSAGAVDPLTSLEAIVPTEPVAAGAPTELAGRRVSIVESVAGASRSVRAPDATRRPGSWALPLIALAALGAGGGATAWLRLRAAPAPSAAVSATAGAPPGSNASAFGVAGSASDAVASAPAPSAPATAFTMTAAASASVAPPHLRPAGSAGMAPLRATPPTSNPAHPSTHGSAEPAPSGAPSSPVGEPSCSVQSYVNPADGEVHFRKVCR